MTNTQKFLESARARLASATPGPWAEQRLLDDGLIVEVNDSTGWKKDYPFAYIVKLGGFGYAGKNGALIASAPTDLKLLADCLEKALHALEWYSSNVWNEAHTIKSREALEQIERIIGEIK